MAETKLKSNYFKLPTGTTAERPSSPEGGMFRKNSSTGYTEYYDDSQNEWIGIGEFYIETSGAVQEEYTEGGTTYKVVYWSNSGTLTVLQGVKEIDFTIVAGGGAGSKGHNTNTSGGGGGGGVISSLSSDSASGVTPQPKYLLSPGTYNITIGGGGTCATGAGNFTGTQGSNSSAFGYTAIGGGAGSGVEPAGAFSYMNGGSGGGADSHKGGAEIAGVSNDPGGSGTTGQGNNGGNFLSTGGGAGGGGGARSVGGTSGGTTTGGDGGAGIASLIRGPDNVYSRSGGGGGTGWQTAPGGAGGGAQYANILSVTSGGAGGSQSTNGGNGTRGGGGGAAKSATDAGNGGSGIIIIRYVLSTS